MELQTHSAFSVFAACAAILVLKMLVVGHYTGILRIRKAAFLNPEDAKQFADTDTSQTTEHPDVERGLRAHRNDLESTLPFLFLGPIYLLTGASAGLATVLFVAFTVLRVVFSVFYIGGIQPWRSLTFIGAELCLLVMVFQTLYWGVTS